MRPPGDTGNVLAVTRQGESVGESETVSGVDVGNVTGWMQERVPSLAKPLRFDLITGGLSNISYRVTDESGNRWVLRRPPLGHVLATAHDMSREFRIIDALTPTNVPVPPLVGLCTDESVNGAPFYVMNFVDGVIARDTSSAESLSIKARRRAGESLVEVLSAIHDVDIDACGLGDLGRKEAYVERQISRWTRQWEATRDRDVPVMEELAKRLAADIPEQGPATIVHGDYRLDNCILDSDGSVVSVLDWELCTLGNPLADVGLMLVYWVESGDSIRSGLPDGTTAEGFATRAELLARYSEITGRDISGIGYFIGLGYWKLACILQGVMVRYRAGAMGSEAAASDSSVDDMFTDQVIALGQAGLAALDGELGSSHG
jgi:aminoglycoside phosphotransferase (APT) family kinase protein